MGLRFEWFGIAEGATSDSRGAISLVAIERAVQIVGELPVPLKRVFVGIVQDDEDPEPTLPESTLTVEISVEDPTGTVIVSHRLPIEQGAKRYDSLPMSVSFTAEMQFKAKVYGTYLVRMQCEYARWEEGPQSQELVLDPAALTT